MKWRTKFGCKGPLGANFTYLIFFTYIMSTTRLTTTLFQLEKPNKHSLQKQHGIGRENNSLNKI